MRVRSLACVLDKPNTSPRLEEVIVDPPGPGEVRVKLAYSGVCHTDISNVRDARYWPVVLGHEGAGTVESVGEQVSHVAPGAHVILSWKTPCGTCHNCLRSQPQWCERELSTAAPHVHRPHGTPLRVLLNAGTFCRYAVVPASAAIPIPDDVPLDKAAVIGCAVATGVGAAMHTARVTPGDSVAIFGVGSVGLNIVQGARLAGAGTIIAVDVDPAKLQLARQFGATHSVHTGALDPVTAVADITAGRGVDHAFEVVGLPILMEQAMKTLAVGGQLVFVGAATRDATLSFQPRLFMSRQQRMTGCIYGSCQPAVDFPQFIEWYRQGQLLLDELVTHEIGLDDILSCFQRAVPQGVRTVIRFD